MPRQVAMVMTFPEVVTKANIEHMRELIKNGPDKHPGAKFYVANKPGAVKKFLKFANRAEVAKLLKPGDRVERHLNDGDVVLFNRQPSLHKVREAFSAGRDT